MSLLIAIGLIVQGYAHIGYLCNQVTFHTAAPGVVTGAFDASIVDGVAYALIATTVVAYTLAAFAVAGFVVPVEWARPLVVVGSAASAVLLATVPFGWTVPGLAIDAVLLVAVVAQSWQPVAFFAR